MQYSVALWCCLSTFISIIIIIIIRPWYFFTKGIRNCEGRKKSASSVCSQGLWIISESDLESGLLCSPCYVPRRCRIICDPYCQILFKHLPSVLKGTLKLNLCRGALQNVLNLYGERLLKLVSERLELHCLRVNLLMCYKIRHHFVDIPQDDFFTICHVIITWGNSF